VPQVIINLGSLYSPALTEGQNSDLPAFKTVEATVERIVG